jgi:CBS domain-containing protein
MTVRDLCHPHVVTIERHATLGEAALLMRSHHVGALLVTGEDSGHHQVSGIVTDRDLALEGLTRGPAEPALKVGDIAHSNLVGVRGDADLAQAVQLMQQHGVRRLLVVDAEGRVGGVLSIDDVVEVMAAQLGALAGALRAGAAREQAASAQPAAQPAAKPPAQQRTEPAARSGVVFLPMGTPGMH